MAHINRRFIDKHWFIFIIRGVLAGIFGFIALFGGMADVENMIAIISLFLLFMGIIDSAGALYNSTKKHGWINSIIDAVIDVAAALLLLFLAQGNLVFGLMILSVYTVLSGVIDIFHGFLSTTDPTDRFIRILAGVCGCIMGAVIVNAGNFEVSTFIRFFGAYMLIVGVTSMIYGVHNRAQNIEDKIARKEARTKLPKKTKKSSRKSR
ncbi:DUF308 domain-containing protein [Candidatus Saccharibacteria bacterium]|nr:DUF308 domain-containing protein [Candidatus Saccharibacteria bacterium]